MAHFANYTNSSMLSTSSYNHTTLSSTNFLEETIINHVISQTWVGLLVGIISFALLGNVLVILVFLIDKRPRMSTHYFIFSLAVSDVITAAFVMTFEVDQFLNGWRHSQALCRIWTINLLIQRTSLYPNRVRLEHRPVVRHNKTAEIQGRHRRGQKKILARDSPGMGL